MDPLAIATARDQLEPRWAAAGEEQPGQLALFPATSEVGRRARDEQLDRIVQLAVAARRPDRRGGAFFLARLVVLEQREVEVGLAAEVVVETADARAGTSDDLGNVGVGNPGLGDHIASGRQEPGAGGLRPTRRAPGRSRLH